MTPHQLMRLRQQILDAQRALGTSDLMDKDKYKGATYGVIERLRDAAEAMGVMAGELAGDEFLASYEGREED
jgi:hypothetical protein